MKRKVTHYEYDCLNQALDILLSIDMPPELKNPRSVMALTALAEIYPGKKWRNASEAYHGTHYIVDFINTHFPNKAGLDSCPYAENSRETFRKSNINNL
ncbi:hypothetical protein [Brachyspira sp.]|uniref:hypothetical protein n=1 Tax=Brachyspira sp. TaxID=1977261 RepID=UPI003D7DF00F